MSTIGENVEIQVVIFSLNSITWEIPYLIANNRYSAPNGKVNVEKANKLQQAEKNKPNNANAHTIYPHG